MGISRVSSSYLMERGVFNLQYNLSSIAKLQDQVSSGQRIHNPSDDPAGLTRLLRLTEENVQDKQYRANIDNALSELSTTEASISQAVEITNRARELAIRAASSTNSQTQLDALALEVDNMLAQVVQIGNTTFGGRYIFGGFKTGTLPFTKTGNDIAYNGTANTDPYQRQVEISKNTQLPININGYDLLGSVTVAAGPPPVASGQGLIHTLTKLKLDLKSGNVDNIRTNIDLIKNNQQTILGKQTTVGSLISQLEMTKNRLEERQITYEKDLASVQGVDLPAAISQLNYQQTVYQASIGVLQKIMETSLANFLG